MMPRAALLTLWSLVLFAACFALDTRHNRFPWHYHPDEPGKVEQVMTGNWNLHHPLLLLGTAKVIVDHSSEARQEQRVVEIGRAVSAAFIAGAIVALSLLAYAWRGWPAALLTGALLGTHHQLFELAHYFKEDSALLFGLSLAALALWLYAERPSARRALFLGAACALAISGKYLGVVSLAFALPVLVKQRARGAGLAFVLALLAVFTLVNWPLFTELTTFRESFGREVALVVKGQGGATQRVPHTEYWTSFRDNTTPAIWLLLVVFLVARWRERRSLSLAEGLLIGFPFAYTLALSFSPKANDRYYLPATAWLCLLAAMGASDLAARWPRRGVWSIAALLLVGAQFPDWSASHPGWISYEQAFQVDDQTGLIEFLRRDVSPNAVLLKDSRIALPEPQQKKHAVPLDVIPQKVIAKHFAADAGDFDGLRAQGITHVIVSESDYGKFFRARLHPQKGQESSFARRREFYSRLFNEADLLWERERGTVIYLHPGIRVYRLR
jgi:hypothetical protein